MTTGSIADAIEDECDERELKLAILGLPQDGVLEEHPEFDDAYVVAD